jgi:hypothetical protein
MIVSVTLCPAACLREVEMCRPTPQRRLRSAAGCAIDTASNFVPFARFATERRAASVTETDDANPFRSMSALSPKCDVAGRKCPLCTRLLTSTYDSSAVCVLRRRRSIAAHNLRSELHQSPRDRTLFIGAGSLLPETTAAPPHRLLACSSSSGTRASCDTLHCETAHCHTVGSDARQSQPIGSMPSRTMRRRDLRPTTVCVKGTPQ